jgi:hypothetical protein
VDNEYTQSENISWPGKVLCLNLRFSSQFTEINFVKAEMMVQLEDTFRANGIVVPLTFNDANELNNYATGKGAVDIYGFDSYPQVCPCLERCARTLMSCWSCCRSRLIAQDPSTGFRWSQSMRPCSIIFSNFKLDSDIILVIMTITCP